MQRVFYSMYPNITKPLEIMNIKSVYDIPMINEDPEVIAEKEGVHKRIQAEIQHEDKEAEMAEEVMLEIPPNGMRSQI